MSVSDDPQSTSSGSSSKRRLPGLTVWHLQRLEARFARLLGDERQERTFSEAALTREVMLRAKFEDVRKQANYHLTETRSELTRLGAELIRLSSLVGQAHEVGTLAAQVERQEQRLCAVEAAVEQRLCAVEAAVDEMRSAELQEPAAVQVVSVHPKEASGMNEDLVTLERGLLQVGRELAAHRAALCMRLSTLETAEQALKGVLETGREYCIMETCERLMTIEWPAECDFPAGVAAGDGHERARQSQDNGVKQAEAAMLGHTAAPERSSEQSPVSSKPQTAELLRKRLEAVEERLATGREETFEVLRARLEGFQQRVVGAVRARGP